MKGSCLCGAIVYEVDQLDMPILHCHCTTCRKAHAAAFTSTAGCIAIVFVGLRAKISYQPMSLHPASIVISVRFVVRI